MYTPRRQLRGVLVPKLLACIEVCSLDHMVKLKAAPFVPSELCAQSLVDEPPRAGRLRHVADRGSDTILRDESPLDTIR